MNNSQSQADLIIGRMQVPDEPGLFVLGCFERPATVYMQQVRALNLIYALDQKRGDAKRKTMLVIGAGAGGITAAAAAAALNWDVTVLEKLPDVLALADGASTHRWLHPHIYDWPTEGAEEGKTNLGIMDWSAESSRAVADQLRGEWKRLERAYKVGTHIGISDVTLGRLLNGKWLVRWNGSGPRPEVQPVGLRPIKKLQQCAADVVILAIGFGQEKPLPPEFPGIVSYWHNDQIDVLKTNGRDTQAVLVSGTGDGGLIDALRYSYKAFRHERVVQKLRDEWLGQELYHDVKAKLRDIERAVQELARSGQPHEAELNWRYHELSQTLAAECARIEFRDDVSVFLAGRDKYPLSLNAAPINRFLLTLTNVQYCQAEVVNARQNPGGAWKVEFKGGNEKEFLDVVIRHGPLPELPQLFPDIYQKVKKFRDSWGKELQAGRDPTRDPLYDETFKASLAASARAAGTPVARDNCTPSLAAVDANSSADQLVDYRTLLAAAFKSPPLDVDEPEADHLAAFVLKQSTNSQFSEQVRLLVAPPGHGKTRLLTHLANVVLGDAIKVPLILQLRSFDASLNKSLLVNAIDTALEALTGDEGLRVRLRAALLAAAMQGKLVLLLDGLDEMPTRSRKALLEALHRSDPDLRRGNCILVGSRPLGTEIEGLPTVQLRVREATAQLMHSILDEIRSGSIKGSLPDGVSDLLGDVALKSLLGQDVAAALATAVGMVSNEQQLAFWLPRRRDGEQGWEFPFPFTQDVLAAMALARSGDAEKIAGLAYDERFAYGMALPLALTLADNASGVYSLLERLTDTLDGRILMLRIKVAKLVSLPPETALRLARDTTDMVATPERATIEVLTTLAETCRGLPSALASLLSSEVSSAFGQQENPELYRAILFFGRSEVPDAGEKLQAWLMHENDAIADAAAEALGELGHEDAIPALVSVYLSSPKPMVFRSAVTAIAAIGGEHAMDALIAIVSNRALHRNMRWPAASALGVLTSDRTLDALLAQTDEPSATLRKSVAEALGNYPGRRKVVDELVRMSRDTDDGVRIGVFQSLARRAETCDIAVLHAGLGDSNTGVRLAAAEGLMRLDRPGLLKSLGLTLAQPGDRWREIAASLFGRMLGAAAIPTLVQLSQETDRYARLGAARALAGSEDEAAIVALLRLAADDDNEVRGAAVDALPVLDRPDVIDAIIQTTLEYKEITGAALRAGIKLKGFRYRRVAEAMRRAVLRPDYASGLAAGVLGVVGDTGDIDLIVTAWRASTFPFSDGIYATAIARIGGERACKALRLFLDHANAKWRLLALYALVEVARADAVPAILHAWADSDQDVKREAAYALQRIDRECLREGLKLSLGSDSAFVQSTAARLAVPYANQEMLNVLLKVDPTAWGQDGPSIYTSILDGMKEVTSLRKEAEALACQP